MYLNKALIIGNLTRDPELKAIPSGVKVSSFSVATNLSFKGKDGQTKDSVEYHNIVVFGRQAETSAQYLKKGQSVLIEGRLQTRSWEQDGVKKYRTEIIADRVQFGPKPGGASFKSHEEQSAAQESNTDPLDFPEDEINPDDIPF